MTKYNVPDEFLPFVDPTAEGAEVRDLKDGGYLLTTRGDDGGQVLLRRVSGQLKVVETDTVIDFSRDPTVAAAAKCAGPCSDQQHAIVADAIIFEVDKFSSATGPDGGNLACVWAVRHIIHKALGFWVTRSDGTATFYGQLLTCFGGSSNESDVQPGGIITSPSDGGKHGHVGLLGAGQGDTRLVYSNSSSKAVWKQNHTIASWRARYVDQKGLTMHFFPLPSFGT